jgi:hypothetical protein
MERVKKSVAFWAMLLAVVVLLPTSLLATKAVYTGKIFKGTKPVGSSFIGIQLVNRRLQYNYGATTFPTAYPGQVVQKVTLAPVGMAWEMTLCETGGDPADDCAYATDGNLNDLGSIVPAMLMATGIDGATFDSALNGGTLQVHLYDAGGAELGVGTYVQTFP